MDDLKTLPTCLVEYLKSPVLERSDAQIRAFLGRTSHVAEVAEAVRQWTLKKERTAFELLDDIDADINAILGSGLSDDASDTLFLIHSSWTADLSAAAMYESLRADVLDFVCSGFGKLLLSQRDVEKWLTGWWSAISATLDDFQASRTADEAVGRVVGVNLLLCKLQMFSAMARLNPLLERGA
ncbi:hypothetical protein [Ralstonia sp. Ralssp110]|uniref:hypothetical protein n=1 Tax=Ralstonia sp. Ralssp110 TaxID=3243004 RepID=UPI0039B3D4FA